MLDDFLVTWALDACNSFPRAHTVGKEGIWRFYFVCTNQFVESGPKSRGTTTNWFLLHDNTPVHRSVLVEEKKERQSCHILHGLPT